MSSISAAKTNNPTRFAGSPSTGLASPWPVTWARAPSDLRGGSA